MNKTYSHEQYPSATKAFQIICYENGKNLRNVCVVYSENDAIDLVNTLQSTMTT